MLDRMIIALCCGGIAYWLALFAGAPKWTGWRTGTPDALDVFTLVTLLVWVVSGRMRAFR